MDHINHLIKELNKSRREKILLEISMLWTLIRLFISAKNLKGPEADIVEEIADIRFYWNRYVKELKKSLHQEYELVYKRAYRRLILKFYVYKKIIKDAFNAMF